MPSQFTQQILRTSEGVLIGYHYADVEGANAHIAEAVRRTDPALERGLNATNLARQSEATSGAWESLSRAVRCLNRQPLTLPNYRLALRGFHGKTSNVSRDDTLRERVGVQFAGEPGHQNGVLIAAIARRVAIRRNWPSAIPPIVCRSFVLAQLSVDPFGSNGGQYIGQDPSPSNFADRMDSDTSAPDEASVSDWRTLFWSEAVADDTGCAISSCRPPLVEYWRLAGVIARGFAQYGAQRLLIQSGVLISALNIDTASRFLLSDDELQLAARSIPDENETARWAPDRWERLYAAGGAASGVIHRGIQAGEAIGSNVSPIIGAVVGIWNLVQAALPAAIGIEGTDDFGRALPVFEVSAISQGNPLTQAPSYTVPDAPGFVRRGGAAATPGQSPGNVGTPDVFGGGVAPVATPGRGGSIANIGTPDAFGQGVLPVAPGGPIVTLPPDEPTPPTTPLSGSGESTSNTPMLVGLAALGLGVLYATTKNEPRSNPSNAGGVALLAGVAIAGGAALLLSARPANAAVAPTDFPAPTTPAQAAAVASLNDATQRAASADAAAAATPTPATQQAAAVARTEVAAATQRAADAYDITPAEAAGGTTISSQLTVPANESLRQLAYLQASAYSYRITDAQPTWASGAGTQNFIRDIQRRAGMAQTGNISAAVVHAFVTQLRSDIARGARSSSPRAIPQRLSQSAIDAVNRTARTISAAAPALQAFVG